jgi:NOL1/NOP2/fmu family ribosome biogenesis protein
LAGNNDRTLLFSYLYERFGISESILLEYLLFKQKTGWFILHSSALLEDVSRIKISKVGLRSFRKIGQFVKPTTRFIQSFGRFATKRVYRISPDDLLRLVAGEQIPVDQDYEKGYVILANHENCILGVGFFINGRIRSQLPGNQLRTAMIADSPIST